MAKMFVSFSTLEAIINLIHIFSNFCFPYLKLDIDDSTQNAVEHKHFCRIEYTLYVMSTLYTTLKFSTSSSSSSHKISICIV